MVMAGYRVAGLARRKNEAGVAEVAQIVDAAETGAVHGRERMVGIGEAAGAPVDGVAAAVYLDGSAGEGAEQGNAPQEGMLEAGLMQVAGVVAGIKGTLPAKGDASRLPANLRDRADAVGEQSELAQLLGRAADRWRRHP